MTSLRIRPSAGRKLLAVGTKVVTVIYVGAAETACNMKGGYGVGGDWGRRSVIEFELRQHE